MISQLMTQLNNTTKSKKYQQDKMMFKQLVVYKICLFFFKKKHKFIAVDVSKQKALDADSRSIQKIIFTGKIKSTVDNTRVIIYCVKRNNA